ncbi:hypothetical protein L210DRAFT_3645838 [Boletus edulis BED1]|uniref:ubiquitinyl hydrolase 1 n=1 Tax=Boletus edulis BED1 TaxID=1328754 RepID=A0AAD4BTZ2_BOLED|nr:hypothetical protein L210DRAFT_3645838 [Boletus edulis BED1]
MSHSVLDSGDITTLQYIVTHVFCPLQLPDGDDYSVYNDHSLVRLVATVARLYSDHVDQTNIPQWHSVSRMLDNLREIVQFGSLDRSQTVSQLGNMNVGDALTFHIRSQNAAVLFRKQNAVTIFESFEVSPKAEDVMTTQGKLICSYPGPAIEIPNAVFEEEGFLSKLTNFLAHMHDDIIPDAAPKSRKAQSDLVEDRDTIHPRYITELLTGILRGVGRPADIVRITKRVGDDVVWNNSKFPWRRSSLWLVIRVAIQTSFDQSTLRHGSYKQFMLFFLCHLANEKAFAHLSNDLLQFMLAKISRRLRKFGSSAPDWLSRIVLQTCTSLRSTLENRWRQVQDAQCVSPRWAPSQLDLARDIELSLFGSGDYIRNSLTHHAIVPPDTLFKPKYHPRGSLDDFLSADGAFFEEAYSAEPHVALHDVERAVEQGIDGWVERVTENDEACVKLEILGNKYSSGALKTYGNNPELLSVMLLTTIELWVALDKIALKEVPILADYSPEVPTSILEDQLLCKTTSLLRLRRLHEYLSRRHSESQSQWSVFSQTITENTFAIRYYKESSCHQHLKSRIEKVASHEVHEKVSELEAANAQYAELQRKAERANHVFATNWYGHEYHSSSCHKCDLERALSNMNITIHEWPLPVRRLDAEVVVFELDCPVTFNMWRSATFHLLVDLCSPTVEPNHPYIQLTGYSALQPYLVRHPRSRITLGSDEKPFIVTHYHTRSIPNTKDEVCRNNGLKFYGFDSHACIPISHALGPFDVRRYCTYELQSKPYRNLQKYVDVTSHTSNEVLANQADCHKDLSVHEYIAFGHLRSGGLVQWLSILRELRGRSFSFRHHDVHLLLAQTVSQVGPLVHGEWIWHQELQRPSFCYALLGELKNLVRDVEANWLEGTTMDTVSFLLRRLLASSPNQTVSLKLLGFLRTVRRKLFSWVEELSSKLVETPGDEDLRGFLRGAAVICRSTFDVDPCWTRQLLHSGDINVLLSCAILIHDHTPSEISSLPAYSQLLLDRDRRLSLRLESVVSDVIQADPDDQGVDPAISCVWSDYRPGSTWTPLQSPNSRWFTCMTAPSAEQMSQVVHYDLLDGSLLVSGKPLGRLPKEILRHPLYNLIFSKHVLDVIPGDLPGMDYSTRGTISGHQVYFSLKNDSDLVIRAKRKHDTGDSHIIELIPQEKLKGDLPAVLIEGHAHWLNLSTSIMEIRPLDSLWEASAENWMIECTPGNYRMRRGNKHLVDIRSQTWEMVSSLLRPLDTPQNLLVTVSPIDDCRRFTSLLQLSVILPRYGLSFYVDEDGDLQSRNIRGMVYDENQSIGTLFGLVNRLVLRPKSRDANAIELIPRCILVPDGQISFRKDSHHVRVEVNTPSELGNVTYQTYKVDTELGCLTGNVSLTNKLYCAYLHALTSGCGTDPLTGRTGTEEALSLLRSASCWSIMKLGPREAELLALIASICPTRTWYPVHLKCMQKVEWLDLPAGTQHHGLYVVANGIKEHCERVLLFQENQSSTLFPSFPLQDEHLLKRGALRAAYLSPFEISGQPSGRDLDVRYSARDLVEVGSAERRAYTAAAAVRHRNVDPSTTKNILSMVQSWTGSVSGDATLSLQYDRSWLAPDLPLIWFKAYNLLRGSDEGKWFQLLFSLPAMAYASPNLADLVPVFIAFASNPQFQWEHPPCYHSYTLSEGYQPCRSILYSYVSDCAYSFEHSPESSEPARYNESTYDLRGRQLQTYHSRRNSDADATAHQLLNHWPCETPPQCSLKPGLYNVPDLTSKVQSHFSSRYRNLKLKEHLARAQDILNNAYSQASPIPILQYSFQPSQTVPPRTSWSLTMDQLFARPAPSLQAHGSLTSSITDKGNTSLRSSARLQQLIATVDANAVNPFHHQYVAALRTSAECFGREVSLIAPRTTELPAVETLMKHYVRCRASYTESLDHVKRQLDPRSQSEQVLQQAGQWPRVTAHALLRSLASSSSVVLPDDWEECLVQLALLALQLQRARRLLRLHLDNLPEELRRELENDGCDGWSAAAHPDWLLIQLQGNFLVRRVQAEVAHEMISPRSGNNTAMQLNMGEGKSSVIVPISVVVLADGTQLVRVIVPKALTAQMFHLLADRLGGLVNRRIYYLPFSRSLEVNQHKVTALREVLSACMKERGILVIQPEHILSLKLVSVEKQLFQAEEQQLAHLLLTLQRWLHSHSRDMLDESDEILHVRYQLVYTIGLQEPMEGSPNRWNTTEQVLGLASKHASSLRELFPVGAEYESGPSGSFPHLRIVHADAGQQLISWIVQDIIEGRLPKFNFGQLRPDLRNAIRSFISCEKVSPTTIQLVQDYSQQTSLRGGLLLLRGLLATGILLYAFRERRWRVDYGLAPQRTMLAVPYRAKDVPAQRAEFGHPDITIIFTCLSYYYGGLTEEQLRLSFEILLKQDDPSLDYDLWIRDCPAVPHCLQTISGVNIQSSEQWNDQLFPLFKQNRATVDFYLSSVVFPKEAKVFPSKLSCSGWDLAEKKERLLTGFSGTNDGQYLLPLHITQRDPDHQRGTNAKVLSYLLQPENKYYICMSRKNGERRTTLEFLEILVTQEPEIRVLLDVGAQMLDLENCELAKAWLTVNTNASAAIYFNDNDELMVLTRDGRTHLFISSPFAQQLDRCVVYLDDAHTRGTDIKFPSRFRAAVTLGPKVTKDRLAQGCMRMRKLGHGHSVMFFAPLEIDRRVRSVAGKGSLDVIDTTDILQWTIRESCDDIQQRAPHWVQQGMDHTSRYAAWTGFCRDELSPEALSNKWLQPEAKKLEDLYGPHKTSDCALETHPDIRQRCIELGIISIRDVSMDEEQEREVVHEAERERQVERPPRVPPATHSIHPDVVAFVKTGIVPTASKGFSRAFETLDVTSAAANEAHIWSPYVLTTADFQKTVRSSNKMDDYLRPVMWVVSGNRVPNDALVILSPYEANHLLSEIRSNDKVHLHVYTPRTTQSMKSCDDLALYSIPTIPAGWTPPPLLMDQLNVFAGQLYLKDYETYIRLCRFLCVYTRDMQDEEGIEVGCDGFILSNYRPQHLQSVSTFQTTPLDSLRTLISIRRKGMRFAPTHMGKLLDGRLLSEDDFDDDIKDVHRA